MGAVVSVFSDDRFRGLSVSDGRPVGTLDLSYDAPNGLYASASGTIVAARGEGLRALAVIFNAGYAKQIRRGLTADAGIVHWRYSHYSGLASGRDNTEGYAGLAGKLIGARISVSPNYFGVVRWTVHGELDAHVDASRRSSLQAAVGLLLPLGQRAYAPDRRPQFDARVGIDQKIGPLTFHALVTGSTGNTSIYGARGRDHAALVFGLSTGL